MDLERVLRRIRLKRAQMKLDSHHFVVTLHALREMQGDGFSWADLRRTVLAGDLEPGSHPPTGERAFVVRGRDAKGRAARVVVRFGPTGSLVILAAGREGSLAGVAA